MPSETTLHRFCFACFEPVWRAAKIASSNDFQRKARTPLEWNGVWDGLLMVKLHQGGKKAARLMTIDRKKKRFEKFDQKSKHNIQFRCSQALIMLRTFGTGRFDSSLTLTLALHAIKEGVCQFREFAEIMAFCTLVRIWHHSRGPMMRLWRNYWFESSRNGELLMIVWGLGLRKRLSLRGWWWWRWSVFKKMLLSVR